MEAKITTHYARFNIDNIKKAMKVYSHIKIPAKKGLLQIVGSKTHQEFQILANVGTGGVLVYKVFNPFDKFTIYEDGEENVSISFQNQPLGNNYIHGKELFSPIVNQASMTFYKRPGKNEPEFVKSEFTLNDNDTRLCHYTSITSWPIPIHTFKMKAIHSRLALSIKTATMLQKWLREKKGSSDQVVKITVNQSLLVAVFTIGENSKTIDFQPVTCEPENALKVAEKQGDYGLILTNLEFYANLDSLIQSLGLCKLAATYTPCICFHPENVVEVIGLPLKGVKDFNSSVSVLLIKARIKAPQRESPSTLRTKYSSLEDSEEETEEAINYLTQNQGISATNTLDDLVREEIEKEKVRHKSLGTSSKKRKLEDINSSKSKHSKITT
ncbi:ORF59 [Felid gammaherpesvirus 1]|uniref:ORF59 n=1 Tax=Felid gammaherpesvirus 1 TaxID=2560468 RepID=A0A0M4LR39_9GAMA|nr:ORF59 [Felis catus gammaherpesvirus 1]ALE14774.1 ORF59 [Felis catus gammaherpesvirus 1]